MQIRSEQSGDEEQLYDLTAAAFEPMNFSDGTEADALNTLRRDGNLVLSPNGHPVITTKLFNAAFPHWITAVQSMANKGVISRAHYLGELKQGIFIVVEGATREEALVNASAVVSEINAVTVNAIEATAEVPAFAVDDACQFIEIGPVAVTPMK